MPSDTRLVGFLSPRTRSSLFSNPTALWSFLQRRKETKSVCLCLSVLVSLCPPLSVCLSVSLSLHEVRWSETSKCNFENCVDNVVLQFSVQGHLTTKTKKNTKRRWRNKELPPFPHLSPPESTAFLFILEPVCNGTATACHRPGSPQDLRTNSGLNDLVHQYGRHVASQWVPSTSIRDWRFA